MTEDRLEIIVRRCNDPLDYLCDNDTVWLIAEVDRLRAALAAVAPEPVLADADPSMEG